MFFLWWQKFGKKDFPQLYLGAMLILAKPSHNGFQERIFSLGNYRDSRLTKRRHEDNFEMGVLEHANVAMMEKFEDYNNHQKSAAKEPVEVEPKNLIESFFFQTKKLSRVCVKTS